jgi:class 3 adenylate cyclase/pimeloyl-ACP methyl ester carboxylesterase
VSRAAVRYAENAGVSIAYQVLGDGPRDLLFVCGTMSHLELWWTDPLATAMLERLARFSRVIIFDKPGTGLSDPIPAAPTIDQRTADLVAVLDAVGSERATILGYSEGGIPSIVLAATQPHRVEALVLLDSPVFMDWTPDSDIPKALFDRAWSILDDACAHWGEGILTTAMAPTWVANPAYVDVFSAIERACMSPGMARSVLQGYHGHDVRDAAAAVHVPTLVLHCVGDQVVPVEWGRDAASRIDGAVFKELAGADHFVWIHNSEAMPDAVEEFLTGQAAGPHDDDRILTTVVFTDIVDSTRRLADGGDNEWRVLLADHDRRMDELLARFDGVAVKHTGDGRLVHFARPARAVRFAAAMAEAARRSGLEIRAGIHTGECESVDGDLFGLAVNIAARVTAHAGAAEVVVSSTVKDLVVGSGLRFTSLGGYALKGAPGKWELHRYDGDRPGPLVAAGYDTDVRHPQS